MQSELLKIVCYSINSRIIRKPRSSKEDCTRRIEKILLQRITVYFEKETEMTDENTVALRRAM